MLADFFRMLFHKVNEGVFYTAALCDEIRDERLHLVYLSDGAVPMEEDTYPLDILAIGDCQETTLKQMKAMVQKRRIKLVILPSGDGSEEIGKYCREQGVEQTQIASQPILMKKERWELRFQTFQGMKGNTLVMYQGFRGDDLTREDCVLTGKIVREEPCVSCIRGEDDYCGFGCLGTKDFDVMKRHKRKGSTSYCMGTLILGSMSMKGQVQKLKEMVEDVSDKIRCVCLPCGLTADNYEEGLFDRPERSDYLYAVGQQGTEPEVVGEIVGKYPCVQYRMINEKTGLCISGYRIPFLREKDC